ncbi:chromate transporter [soil metagenome]
MDTSPTNPDIGTFETNVPSVSLGELFLLFFKLGLTSVGGGMIAWAFREIVTERKWITADEFFAGNAIATIMPGANVTNIAVFVGDRMRGLPGAAAALFGLVLGPFFCVISFFALYDLIAGSSWAQNAINGMVAAAIGPSLIFVYNNVKHASRGVFSLISLAATFIGIGVLHWPMVPVVVVVGIFSIATAWPRKISGG